MTRSLRMLERMVNQNNHNEISLGNHFYSMSHFSAHFLDFKFYEDQADEFKENEGTLLPLWSFTFDKAASLENTGLCWNPAYSDLFAASYGSCISYILLDNINNLYFVFRQHVQAGRIWSCMYILTEEPLLPRIPVLGQCWCHVS